MTIDISANNPRISYTVGTGVTQTVFAVPFEFFDDSDLNVYIDTTLQTITTDYTVTGGAGSTGSITMSVTGPKTVTLTRDTTIERTTDFTAGVDINRAALNTQLDTLTAISADNKDLGERSIRVFDYDNSNLNLELGNAASRANKILSFDSNGSVTHPATTSTQLDAAVSSFVNASGNNAASILYDPSGTGAVQTTAQAKLRQTVSVKDFGAAGDGSADDTAEIQAALTAASGTSNVYLPAGTYIVSATIFIPSNTYFFGDGKSSIIKMIGTEGRNTTVVMTGFRNNKRENIVIEDMQIDFNRTRWAVTGGTQLTDAFNGTAGYSTYQDNDETALSICYSENVLVKNVWAIDGYKHCIDVTAPAYRTGTDGSTYDSQPSKNVTLQNCYVSGGGDDNITTHHSTDINIIGCWSENPSGVRIPQNSNCIEIDDGSRNVFVTSCVTIGGNYGLQIKGHDYAPAPYNVIVSGRRSVNKTKGVELRHSG